MKYSTKILRNEGDEDYGRQHIFPKGTDYEEATFQLALDFGVDYVYKSRDVWDQMIIVIED